MSDLVFDSTLVNPGSNARMNQARVAAGVTVDPGDAVFKNTDGELDLASAGAADEAVCVGIAMNGGSAGQPVDYCYEGDIEFGDEVLQPGMPYCISPTPGAIRPCIDLLAGEYSGHIGIATDYGTLQVKLHCPGVAVNAS